MALRLLSGSNPGETSSGSAVTFDQARAEFETAWRIFLAKRTPEDFEAWRFNRDFTAWKTAMWDAGLRTPTQRDYVSCPGFAGLQVFNVHGCIPEAGLVSERVAQIKYLIRFKVRSFFSNGNSASAAIRMRMSDVITARCVMSRVRTGHR